MVRQMATPESSRPASAEQRLKELGIKLPMPPQPFGIYVEAVQTGDLLKALQREMAKEGRGVDGHVRDNLEQDL